MSTWASRRLSNCHRLSSSSRTRLLNDSIQAFCHGDPGSDDVEDLHLAAVDGVVEREVHRPQRVRPDGAHRPDVGADASQALLAFFVGTCSPSSRQRRRTRLLFTDQPSRRSAVAARRHPHRGRRRANARKNSRSWALSSEGAGRDEALSGPVLTDDRACSSFGDPETVLQHRHGALGRRFGVTCRHHSRRRIAMPGMGVPRSSRLFRDCFYLFRGYRRQG